MDGNQRTLAPAVPKSHEVVVQNNKDQVSIEIVGWNNQIRWYPLANKVMGA